MEQELINNEMQVVIERIKIKNTSYKRTNKWSFIFCFFVSVLLVLLVLIRRGLPNSEVTSLFAAAFPMWAVLYFVRWRNAEKVERITDPRALLSHFDSQRRIEWVLFVTFLVILEGVVYYSMGYTAMFLTAAVVVLIVVVLRFCGVTRDRDIECLSEIIKQENDKK
ncbi:MAG: hypothetical protein II905_03340 [Muribaculaceae bacterium]|nr:hypothetical protein [Muribaculaceae bacterium]